MSSTTKFGASVEVFRNAEMLVMLSDTPVGILTCIQLPITKSIYKKKEKNRAIKKKTLFIKKNKKRHYYMFQFITELKCGST